MTATTETWKHRLGDVLVLVGAGYIGLSIFGPLFFPYDVLAAGLLLGLGAWIGDYRGRWWPAARYAEREHELKLTSKERARK